VSKHRREQVASVLRRAIQQRLLRGLADPRVTGAITVTEVKVAGDLKTATVFVSVTPEEDQELTMHGLRSAAKHIRHEISERVTLPHTPFLNFKLDKSLKTQSKVLDLIARGVAEIDEREQRRRDHEADPAQAADESNETQPQTDVEKQSIGETESERPE